MARTNVDEITVKKEDGVEVYFGKKGRYSISFDTYEEEGSIVLYDNAPNSASSLATPYKGSFKDFRKLLSDAKETSDSSTGTATAF